MSFDTLPQFFPHLLIESCSPFLRKEWLFFQHFLLGHTYQRWVYQRDCWCHVYPRWMANIAHTRGIFSGGIILTLFGGFWSILALVFWPPHPSWAVPLAVVVIILLLLLCIQRLWATRGIRNAHDPVAAAKAKRSGMWFGIIFGIEGGLIALSCALLGRHGQNAWIPIVIALIVGVHFLPLAKVFDVSVYYWTGALSTLGVLACLLIGDFTMRVLCVGLVMAAVLWLTVAYLLMNTRVVP